VIVGYNVELPLVYWKYSMDVVDTWHNNDLKVLLDLHICCIYSTSTCWFVIYTINNIVFPSNTRGCAVRIMSLLNHAGVHLKCYPSAFNMSTRQLLWDLNYAKVQVLSSLYSSFLSLTLAAILLLYRILVHSKTSKELRIR
jgi:hypothetical protein